MRHLFDLYKTRRALRALPPREHAIAHRDPTMLFTGVMLGHAAFIETGYHHVLWPLKTALFLHGDRIVEAHVRRFGTARLRELLQSHQAEDRFMRFPAEDMEEIAMEDEHALLDEDYSRVEHRAREALPALSDEKRERLLAHLVATTRAALESVLLQDEWGAVDKADSGAGEAALAVVQKEEQAKNVRVVVTSLQVKECLGPVPDFPHSDDEIVSATSRWFTLLDDPLDILEDLQQDLPNYLVAWALREGELPALKQAVAEGWGGQQPLRLVREAAPRTHAALITEYEAARRRFIRVFPVLPRLFAWTIERAARRRGRSPF